VHQKIAGLKAFTPRQTSVPALHLLNAAGASVGLTEEAARGRRRAIKVGRFPIRPTPGHRARRDEGLIKTIFDEGTGSCSAPI